MSYGVNGGTSKSLLLRDLILGIVAEGEMMTSVTVAARLGEDRVRVGEYLERFAKDGLLNKADMKGKCPPRYFPVKRSRP